MKQLITLLSLGYPIAAFSTSSFASSSFGHTHKFSTTPTTVLPLNNIHKRTTQTVATTSQLHLRIPRGGQVYSETDDQILDLDDLAEEEQPTAKAVEPEPATTAAAVSTKTSCALMGILSPITTLLQCAGTSYTRALGTNPIITKSLTAGLTFFLSDYTAQRMERPKQEAQDDTKSTKKKAKSSSSAVEVVKHDWTRTLTSMAVGLFYFGPAAHVWYEWIFRILPSTTLFSTLQKAALGQVIFGPSFTCIFFATSLLQSGQFTLGNWVQKIRRDLPGAFVSGIGFWPIVDLISYSMIPIQFIPLFINSCSFVWTIYLSTIANRPSGGDLKSATN